MKFIKTLINKSIKSAAVLALATGTLFSQPVFAQEPFIGEIRYFGGNFEPRGWAFCDGRLMSVSSNDALFAILGTTYGGDGRTTFALPDLRGRVPVHPGRGPGLPERRLGDRAGTPSRTLTVNNLPSHTHENSLLVSTADANTVVPSLTPIDPNDALPDNVPQHALAVQRIPLQNGAGSAGFTTAAPTVPLIGGTVGNSGGGQSFDTYPPFQSVNCIIALQGTFPSRN